MNHTLFAGDKIRVTLEGSYNAPVLACHLDANLLLNTDHLMLSVDRMGPWEDPALDPDMPNVSSADLLRLFYDDPAPYAPHEGGFRPSEADYALYAAGNQTSSLHPYRLPALLAALGGMLRPILAAEGVTFATHIAQCGDVRDEELPECDEDALREAIDKLQEADFAVLDSDKAEEMQELIESAREEGDTVGGVLETVVCGLPAGLGSPWDTLESKLSRLLYTLPYIKGVEFGMGFGFAYLTGSEANDQLTSEEGVIRTKSNLSGGFIQGMTCGMPLLFRTAVRPAPGVALKGQTVDPKTMEEKELELEGPFDTAAFTHLLPAVDGLTALLLADLVL